MLIFYWWDCNSIALFFAFWMFGGLVIDDRATHIHWFSHGLSHWLSKRASLGCVVFWVFYRSSLRNIIWGMLQTLGYRLAILWISELWLYIWLGNRHSILWCSQRTIIFCLNIFMPKISIIWALLRNPELRLNYRFFKISFPMIKINIKNLKRFDIIYKIIFLNPI